MMHKRLASSRKGVSEIIAALLVISITISAGALFAAYASGLMGSIQKQVTTQPYLEQLTLDYYTWPCPSGNCYSSTAGSLTITIRNDGAAPITFVDFFMQGVRNTTNVTPTSCYVLPVQSSCTLTFQVPTGLTSTLTANGGGIAYIVKLVAKDGAIFTFSCIYGSYTH